MEAIGFGPRLWHKIFAGVFALLLLGQHAHKTGARGSEVARQIEEVRRQLDAQLAAQLAPGPDYCGTVGCTPHPDSREFCLDLDTCTDVFFSLAPACYDAWNTDECQDAIDQNQDVIDAYQPHCDWLDEHVRHNDCDFDDTALHFDECPRFAEQWCEDPGENETYDSTDAGEPNSTDAGEPNSTDAGEPNTTDADEPNTTDAGEPNTTDVGEPNTCDHNWGNGDHHLTDYPYEKYKQLDEGDQVVIHEKYYDGPSKLVSTRSYEEGLPGTIVRTETRDVDGEKQCGVVIRFHGSPQDNTMYPAITDPATRARIRRRMALQTRFTDDEWHLALKEKYDMIAQMAQVDLSAYGPNVIDEEVFIPRDEHHATLWRVYTHPNNGRLLDLDECASHPNNVFERCSDRIDM